MTSRSVADKSRAFPSQATGGDSAAKDSATKDSAAKGSATESTSASGASDGERKSAPVYASDVVAMAKQQKRKGKASGASGSAAPASILPDRTDAPESTSLGLPELPDDVPMESRPALVLRMAEEAFAKTGSWVIFYREMLGCNGVVSQLYETKEARRYFETTPEFEELLEMVAAIRSQDDGKAGTHEPVRVITVRMPRSLHEATVREAEELELSINNYCLTKLLQPANAKCTPVESGKRRGRRPGPQITVERVKIQDDKKRPAKPRRASKRSGD